MMIKENSLNRIISLQGLRAILFGLIFIYHLSMIGHISETVIYKRVGRGGGTEAVAIFFVLSGFVEAIHPKCIKYDFINIIKLCVQRVKRFYKLHIFFLILTIPTMVIMIAKFPVKYFIRFIINLFLFQSWFPNEEIWLSYNGVTWFLSTLVFLFLFIIPLHKLSSRIEKNFYARYIYILIAFLLICFDFIVAIVVGKMCQNIKYLLYAFPPIRLIDYCTGFVTGKIFMIKKEEYKEKNIDLVTSTMLEALAIGIITGYLIMYPLVPVELSRAVIYLPGAAFVIYILAFERGKISNFFSLPILVSIGNNSLYYMISHQVVLRYCSLGKKFFDRFNWRINEWIWGIIALIIMFISKPLYDNLDDKLKSFFKRKIKR